jgi:hypothetical protein
LSKPSERLPLRKSSRSVSSRADLDVYDPSGALSIFNRLDIAERGEFRHSRIFSSRHPNSRLRRTAGPLEILI